MEFYRVLSSSKGLHAHPILLYWYYDKVDYPPWVANLCGIEIQFCDCAHIEPLTLGCQYWLCACVWQSHVIPCCCSRLDRIPIKLQLTGKSRLIYQLYLEPFKCFYVLTAYIHTAYMRGMYWGSKSISNSATTHVATRIQ